MIKHIVLLKFKDGVTDDQIDRIFQELAALQDLIPGMTDYIAGPYSSDEGLNQGYTHGFIMTFETPEARDTYLPHPEHERVKAQAIPHLDQVVAFDFEV